MWIVFTLLSALSYSFANVFDSSLVRRYEKSPVLLMWSQSVFSIPILVVLALSADIQSSWFPVLMGVGVIAFLGDLLFFKILDYLDISIVNAAWAIQGLLISIAGFFMFGEVWTGSQALGATLILIAVLALSFWHTHISLRWTLLLLTALACLYVPLHIARKAAFIAGETVLPVFFWIFLGRELMAISFSPIHPGYRKLIPRLFTKRNWPIFSIGAFVILTFFLAEYFITRAAQIGPISLIGIVANTQPFMVIGIAWLLWLIAPKLAPKELITKKSITVKLGCFLLVFLGLALLAVSP